MFMSAGNLIIWRFKKQSVVTLSICEIEYIAASYTARVAIWLRNLIDKVEFTTSAIPPPILITINNQRAIVMTKMDAPNRRMRYINIRYHHFREYIEQDIIDLYYISTNEILAENFIKSLNRLNFIMFAISIDMHG
jgi:hypothetical protein